jgi:hypothetical protein
MTKLCVALVCLFILGCENLPPGLNPCEYIDCSDGTPGGATGSFPPDVDPPPLDPETLRGSVLGTASEAIQDLACQDARGDADSQCQSAGCLVCASKSECVCSCSQSGGGLTPVCTCSVVGALCLQ